MTLSLGISPFTRFVRALPETLWPEVARRFLAHPALWHAAEDPAWIELARAHAGESLELWRPGPLALMSVAGEPDAERWERLVQAGSADTPDFPPREAVAAAYERLTRGDEPDPGAEFSEAGLASIALRLRLEKAGDWDGLAAEALRGSPHWALPIICLMGWVKQPVELVAALLKLEPEGAAPLAANALLANFTLDEVRATVDPLARQLPLRSLLALAERLAAHGIKFPTPNFKLQTSNSELGSSCPAFFRVGVWSLPALAGCPGKFERSEPVLAVLEELTHSLDTSLLSARQQDFEVARVKLAQTWQLAQAVLYEASLMLADTAHRSDDPVTGLAVLDEADRLACPAALCGVGNSLDPRSSALRAECLTQLGRPADAVACLPSTADHPLQLLALAQAYQAQSDGEQAARAARAALTRPSPLFDRSHYRLISDLLRSCGDLSGAAEAQSRVVEANPADATAYLELSELHGALGNWPMARDEAEAAVVLDPGSAPSRRQWAACLRECDAPDEALAQFKAASALMPEDASLALDVARAALAVGDYKLAAETAAALLTANRQNGEAHAVMGQVYAAQGERALALESFTNATRYSPSSPMPWMAVAETLVLEGKPEQAITVLQSGKLSAPDSSRLLSALAELLVRVGRPTEAIAELQAAVALSTSCNDVPLLRRLGTLLRAQGRLDESRETLERAVAISPSDPESNLDFGLALEAAGDLDRALISLGQVLRSSPRRAQAWYAIGRCRLKLARRSGAKAGQDAVSSLEEAASLQPDLPAIYAWLGAAREENGEFAKALAAFQAAAKEPREAQTSNFKFQTPKHWPSAWEFGVWSLEFERSELPEDYDDLTLAIGRCCLALKQPAVAIAALTSALEQGPEDATRYALLCQAYSVAGLPAEALKAMQRAVELSPSRLDLLHQLAAASEAAGQPVIGVQALQRAVEITPDDGLAHAALGALLTRVGRVEEGRAALARALGLGPESGPIHSSVARALLELGEIAEALELAQRATRLSPDDPVAISLLGQAAWAAGNFEAAHAAYARAAHLQPGQAGHWQAAGEAQWQLGNYAKAVSHWKSALEIRPEDSQTQTRLGMALARMGHNAEALAVLEGAARAAQAESQLQTSNLKSQSANLEFEIGSLKLGVFSLQPSYFSLALKEAARVAMSMLDYDRAAGTLDQLLAQAPDDAEALFLRGEIHLVMDGHEQALAAFQHAARCSPYDGTYLAGVARALLMLGQEAEALQAIRNAQAAAPDGAEVQVQAGEVLLRLGGHAEAADAFEQAALAQPRDPLVHLRLARALVLQAEALLLERLDPISNFKLQTSNFKLQTPNLDFEVGSLKFERSEASARVLAALNQAAGLGADADTLREYSARARAALGNPAEALGSLEAIVLVRPSAELHAALASTYRRAGHLARAHEAVQAAIDRGPLVATSWIERGLIFASEGKSKEAISSFERAAELDPKGARPHHLLALTFQAAGETGAEQAIAHLSQALALQPDRPAWHHRLALLYRARGDQAAALAHAQKAAQLAPGNSRFASDLAQALMRDGDFQAAADMFARATAANPTDPANWLEGGEVLLRLEDPSAAASYFEHATRLAPSDPRAWVGASRADLALGKVPEAQALAGRALRLAPDDPTVLTALADVEAKQGKAESALRKYTDAAARSSNPVPILLAKGRLLLKSGRPKDALMTLGEAARADRSNDDAFALLGDAYAGAGDFEHAVAAYRRALEIAPRNFHHHLGIAKLFIGQGQLDQALMHLSQAANLAPGNSEVQLQIGRVYEGRRQYDRALHAYQKASELDPLGPEACFRAGVMLKLLKQYPESVQLLERAVELDPKNVEAHRQLAAVSALGLMYGATKVTS